MEKIIRIFIFSDIKIVKAVKPNTFRVKDLSKPFKVNIIFRLLKKILKIIYYKLISNICYIYNAERSFK